MKSSFKNFSTETNGKWILAGEHSVLRGYPALVFPLLGRGLQLEYINSDQAFRVNFSGEYGADLRLPLWGLLEQALEKAGKSRDDLSGNLNLTLNLPLGAGLGASATICGAVAKWFVSLGWVDPENTFNFALELENIFHGESSGVDLAVALSGQGLRYLRKGEKQTVEFNWKPKLYLSYSGHRAVTSECVLQVKDLLHKNSRHGQKLDEQMNEAVTLAQKSLTENPECFAQLKMSILLARDCFESWGLCDGAMGTHIKDLEEKGAVAVKPTGSGGGGYALSLWDQEPELSLQKNLWKLF